MECRIDGIPVNYAVAGSGRPIVMVHGYSVDHRLMAGCMEPVFRNRHDYKRVYVDLPGMGQTKGEKWTSNSDAMLDVLISFIEKTVPDQTFLLAGESYGGYLARGVLHRMADRVDGLLLLCPAIIPDNVKRSVPPHVVLERDEELLSRLEPSDAEGFSSIQVVQNRETWRSTEMKSCPPSRRRTGTSCSTCGGDTRSRSTQTSRTTSSTSRLSC